MTTATLYIRPPIYLVEPSSSYVFYVVFRGVTGLFSAINASTSERKKYWKPAKNAAWFDTKTGRPTVEFASFIDYLSETVLGGSRNKTLPQVESLITYSQAESLFSSLIGQAMAQQLNAVAQAVASVREVLNTNSVPGAAQVPAVPLQPVEVPRPPESFGGGDSGGGGDGGGGSGGGD